jgi:hypothetical protein
MTPDFPAVVAVWVATVGLPQAAHDYALAHHLRATQNLWIATGVMEERERERFFTSEWAEGYHTGVMVDRANRTTAKTPPFSDRYGLPPKEWAWANVAACRRYLRWLEWERPWATPQVKVRIDLAADYTSKAMTVWSLVGDIQGSYCSDSARFLLERLRTLVGEEDYAEWRLPTALPPWVSWDEVEDVPEEELTP